MNRKTMGIVGGVVIALGIWLMLRSMEAPEEEAPAVNSEGNDEVTPRPPAGSPPAEPEDAAAPEAEEAEALPVEAQVAALAVATEATGLGRVRCVFEEAPDGPVTVPLKYAVWDGNVVHGLVEQTEGMGTFAPAPPPAELLEEDMDAWRAQLKASRVPASLLAWGDAFPGETGWCEVREPYRVTLSGRIETEDGQPATDAWVNGCAKGSTHPDGEGNFSMEVWAGGSCELWVRASGMPGAGVRVSLEQDVSDIVLIDRPIDAAEAQFAEADALAWEGAMVHPLQVALEEDGLDEDVRAALSMWHDADVAERERMQATRERFGEFFEENAAKE